MFVLDLLYSTSYLFIHEYFLLQVPQAHFCLYVFQLCLFYDDTNHKQPLYRACLSPKTLITPLEFGSADFLCLWNEHMFIIYEYSSTVITKMTSENKRLWHI